MDLGGKRFLVLHCPGHTPGSIALLDEEEKLLFSGDTVSLGPVYMFGRNRRPSVYLETLKRLWTMAEEGRFSLVYPHHNTAPIPAEKIRTLIECMEGILQGTLDGEPAGLKIPGSEMVKLYQKEDCGIYY
ncbi:MAG TPA: MBL fold metallo-hydrolase [Candidatus Cottocaccamicrobium excrementipullorum]|nr:MBL fold metallo-hydrolase [Candidatus Cottocaccamicrobium excrementipullorum]